MTRMVGKGISRVLLVLAVGLFAALGMAPLAFADNAHESLTASSLAGEQLDGTEWSNPSSLPSAPGSYTLTTDVVLNTCWKAPADIVRLSLNGHSITLAQGQYDEIIVVPYGSTLRISDSVGTGKIKGNGTCEGIDVYGTLELHGGALCDTYSGVEIFSVDSNQSATFSMSGGTITNVMNGWGVHVYGPYATFNMSGGSITGNSCHYGVLTETGTFNISGSPAIFGNKHTTYGDATNVHLYQNPKTGKNDLIHVTGTLSNVKKIGVSTDEKPTPSKPVTITSGYGAVMGDVDPATYFEGDVEGVTVTWNAEHTEAALAVACTVKFYPNNGTTDTMPDQKILPGVATALSANAFSYTDHEFKTWNTKADGTGTTYTDQQVVTLNDDLELYAQWGDTFPITVVPALNGTVVANRAAAGQGDTVKLTVTPAAGYELEELVVNGPSGAIAVTNNEFTMPRGNATIMSSFHKKSSSVTAKTMYRLYNRWSGEHLYTADKGEYDTLGRIGWSQEGEAWKAPANATLKPVYRLYNHWSGDHHYTTELSEFSHLISIGWTGEGIGWYSADSKDGVPLYRLFNPYAQVGSHLYTTSASERDELASIGWRAEGVGWYGLA